MSNNILHIKNLNKSYVRDIVNVRGKKEDERLLVLDDLNLEIECGKITALIGGNGTGKTTLLNIINGLIPANSGEIIFYNGREHQLTKYKTHQIANAGVGRSFQDNHIFPEFTVLENLMIAVDDKFGEIPFVSIFRPQKNRITEIKRKQQAENILIKLFGKESEFYTNRNKKAKNFSYGQQRLIGLTRLFAGNYKLVLLDEPTSGINPQLFTTISVMLKTMVTENNLTVLFIEHNMEFVKNIADCVAYLNKGKVTLSGTVNKVLNHEWVKNNYVNNLKTEDA